MSQLSLTLPNCPPPLSTSLSDRLGDVLLDLGCWPMPTFKLIFSFNKSELQRQVISIVFGWFFLFEIVFSSHIYRFLLHVGCQFLLPAKCGSVYNFGRFSYCLICTHSVE